jgi:hypothetical protein
MPNITVHLAVVDNHREALDETVKDVNSSLNRYDNLANKLHGAIKITPKQKEEHPDADDVDFDVKYDSDKALKTLRDIQNEFDDAVRKLHDGMRQITDMKRYIIEREMETVNQKQKK